MSVVGGISIKKVLAIMTLDSSMDGATFKVFMKRFLWPQLWVGAVVVMDHLPAHAEEVESLIKSVGASILYLSSYSPEVNPIEHWWSPLKRS